MNKIDAFFAYLEQFEWNASEYLETIIQCIDESDNIKDHSYKSLKEAFLAGEELAILLHEPCCTEVGGYPIFIDNIDRPATSYADTTGRNRHCLIESMEDCMVLTIQNSLRIKRFGVTSGFDGWPSQIWDCKIFCVFRTFQF